MTHSLSNMAYSLFSPLYEQTHSCNDWEYETNFDIAETHSNPSASVPPVVSSTPKISLSFLTLLLSLVQWSNADEPNRVIPSTLK